MISDSYGPGDCVKSVSKLRVIMLAYAALSDEYDAEMMQLEQRAMALDHDSRQVRKKYDGLMRRVAEMFIDHREMPEALCTPACTARKTTTEATLYTEAGVLRGSVCHAEGERISDLLNDLPRGQLWQAGRLFEVRDTGNLGLEPNCQTEPARLVSRSAVHMVTLADRNAGRGAGARGDTNGRLFVRKSPVPVSVETEDGSLFGSIHCTAGQEPQDVLKGAPAFISLTDVSIRLKSGALRFTVPYVALNKERVRGLSRNVMADSTELLENSYLKLLKSRLGYS